MLAVMPPRYLNVFFLNAPKNLLNGYIPTLSMVRIAVIEKPKCHPLRCGNYLCIKLCPVNRTGNECIVVDELDQKAKINTELCTGCGICPKRCPFGAIHIVNLPEMLKGPQLHRYGANGFHLFN